MAEFINVEKKINEGILPEPLLAEELKEGDEVMAVVDQLMGEVLPLHVHQANAHVVEDEDESEQSMDDPHPLGMDDDEDEEMDGDEDDDMEGDGIDDDEEDPDEEEHQIVDEENDEYDEEDPDEEDEDDEGMIGMRPDRRVGPQFDIINANQREQPPVNHLGFG